MDFTFVTFLDDEAPSHVEKLTVKFEADTSALHDALDDVLDHVDEVNAALGGYLDEPAIGDVVMLVSGGELMTVEGFCECGSVDVVWFSGNDSEGWIINRDTFDVGMLVCVDDE